MMFLLIIISSLRSITFSITYARLLLLAAINSLKKSSLLLAWMVCLLSLSMTAQEKKLNYSVVRNGEVIGHLNLLQIVEGHVTYIKAESEVKARFILSLTLCAREESVFKEGVLVSSSVNRKLNGKEKANIKITLDNATYSVNDEGATKPFQEYPIHYNVLSMYGTEPRSLTRAYSDSFKEFVSIEKTGAAQYRLTLPDGSYNNYFYQDGTCIRVDVHHTLYSLQFILLK